MLSDVARVRDQVIKHCGEPPFDLEKITNIFLAHTPIDKLQFVQYDTPRENPIWGEFTRWRDVNGVYQGDKTKVEIRYAAHLLDKEDWLRFVVCKELCHSLDATEGKHDVSERVIDNLVGSFSLISAEQKPKSWSRPFRLEMMAEVGALELLCPLKMRQDIIIKDGVPDASAGIAIAARFHFPFSYVQNAFDPEMMAMTESLLAE